MRAAEVMTSDVVVVRPDAMVREAARKMHDLNVGVLPVCDGHRLVGIVTDRDITVRATADGMQPDVTPVHMVMTADVQWCFASDSIADVEHKMAEHQVRRLPVVDADKRLVGIVTLGDLSADRARGTEETLRAISTPAAPDRATKRPEESGGADSPWPAYGEATPDASGRPRG